MVNSRLPQAEGLEGDLTFIYEDSSLFYSFCGRTEVMIILNDSNTNYEDSLFVK